VTDRRTDRQTDRILITIPRLHYMQRGKNHEAQRKVGFRRVRLAARFSCAVFVVQCWGRGVHNYRVLKCKITHPQMQQRPSLWNSETTARLSSTAAETVSGMLHIHIAHPNPRLDSILSASPTPCFRKKTSTHIIGYKLRKSCLILIIADTKIPHIIWHRMTA